MWFAELRAKTSIPVSYRLVTAGDDVIVYAPMSAQSYQPFCNVHVNFFNRLSTPCAKTSIRFSDITAAGSPLIFALPGRVNQQPHLPPEKFRCFNRLSDVTANTSIEPFAREIVDRPGIELGDVSRFNNVFTMICASLTWTSYLSGKADR